MFGGFEGESYADIPTVVRTVGLVPPETRAARTQEMKEIADFAKLLGVKVVALHLGFVPHDTKRPAVSAKSIAVTRDAVRSLPAATARACTWKPARRRPTRCWRSSSDVRRDNLFINFDPANMILYGTGEPIAALEEGRPLRAEHPLQGRHVGRQPRQGVGRRSAAGPGRRRHGELPPHAEGDRLRRPADDRARDPARARAAESRDRPRHPAAERLEGESALMSYGGSPSEYRPAACVPSNAAPQKKRSAGTIVLLVLGVGFLGIVGLIVLIAGAGALYVWSSKTEELTDGDRQLVVTADKLADHGFQFEFDPAGEKIEKTRYVDKTAEIEYEYEHPDENTPLYINCSVHQESDAKEARTLYATLQVSVLAGMRLAGGGVEQTERNDLLKWGDDSRCGLLVNQGFNVGNYFFARKGNKIYCLLIAGDCIDNSEELRALLLPHLERLEGHKL